MFCRGSEILLESMYMFYSSFFFALDGFMLFSFLFSLKQPEKEAELQLSNFIWTLWKLKQIIFFWFD